MKTGESPSNKIKNLYLYARPTQSDAYSGLFTFTLPLGALSITQKFKSPLQKTDFPTEIEIKIKNV